MSTEIEEQLRDTRKSHTSLTRADVRIPEPSVEGAAKGFRPAGRFCAPERRYGRVLAAVDPG